MKLHRGGLDLCRSLVNSGFLMFITGLIVRPDQQVVEVDVVEDLDQSSEEVTAAFSVIRVVMRTNRGLPIDKTAERIELSGELVIVDLWKDHVGVAISAVTIEQVQIGLVIDVDCVRLTVLVGLSLLFIHLLYHLEVPLVEDVLSFLELCTVLRGQPVDLLSRMVVHMKQLIGAVLEVKIADRGDA